METADRMLRRNLAARSTPDRFAAGDPDQRQPHPVRILEGEHRLAEALLERPMRHAFCDEPVCPIADGADRHSERCLLGLADAEPPAGRVLPWEEGQDRAGPALLVAIIEMIGAGIVEIDRLLDEPEPEAAGVEVDVPLAGPAIAVTW